MIRIIGLGSPFGDDRAGWRVIDAMRGRTPAGVDLVSLDRPGVSLVQWVEGVDELVVVDALRGERPAGTVAAFELDQVEERGVSRLSGHALGLRDSLALAARLGMAPRKSSFYGIFINDLDHESEVVCEGCERLADQLLRRYQGVAALRS